MLFRLRWLDEASWKVYEAVVEEPSESLALARLPPQAVRLLSATQLTRRFEQPTRLRVDVAWWCRELRVLLAAGMTVVEAIETMGSQAKDPSRTTLHDRLNKALGEGKSLSSAMVEADVFPAILLAGVVASERTGALVEALDDYLRYHDMAEQLGRKLVSAALYPMLVLSVGLVVVVFLLWFVVPRFSAAYADLRGGVGGATHGLLLASAMLRGHSAAIAGGIVLGLAVLVWAWRRGLLLHLALGLADAVAPVRLTLDEFRRAKLFNALALMFRGGYSLPEAFERCLGIGLGVRWNHAINQARQSLLTGASVAHALATAGVVDVVGEKLIVVGERTGAFAHVLQTIADRHGTRFATTIERFTRLAEPLLLLMVATGIGFVVVLMYLPIFDLASSLK